MDVECTGTAIRDFHNVADGSAFDEELVTRMFGAPPGGAYACVRDGGSRTLGAWSGARRGSSGGYKIGTDDRTGGQTTASRRALWLDTTLARRANALVCVQ